jgi:hypothetical protein
VNIAVLDKIDSTPNTDWEPDLVVSMGRFVTSSQNTNTYDVGLDAYNLSTSHFEITPTVYTSSFTNIHMYGTWGTAGGGTNSTLYVESDAFSVKELFFGDVTNGQSIYVSDGNLYLNGSTFSGGGTSSGTSGPQGETGPQGFDGATGQQGETGPQGFDGATGQQGATGPAGSPLIFSGAWQTLPAIYGIDEYVTYGGSTWFTYIGALDGIPPSPTNSNWTLFGGAALIVGTSIPTSSADTGSKGEIRVDNGQYLYIHTGAQWLKSSMTFSTF